MTTPISPLAVGRAIGYADIAGRRAQVYPSPEYVRIFNALLQRTGGSTTDLIAASVEIAAQAKSAAESAPVAAIAAYDAGAPAGYTLSPAPPFSVVNINTSQAHVSVQAHTRTPTGLGAISLNASAAPVTIQRGNVYTIYYVDPTDAGGAVTYLATTDSAIAADYAGGKRIVGQAFAAEHVPVYGGGGGNPLP